MSIEEVLFGLNFRTLTQSLDYICLLLVGLKAAGECK